MRSNNFDFAKNFLHLSILAGDFQRVDLLFGSNTGDGISQLGGNLLTDPEKYYKVFIIMMNTEEILRNTARSCKRTLPQRDLGSCSADLNGGKKTSTWLSGSGNFLGQTNSVLMSTSRYFYTGENVLSKTVDSEMVSLMTDNMYQVGKHKCFKQQSHFLSQIRSF